MPAALLSASSVLPCSSSAPPGLDALTALAGHSSLLPLPLPLHRLVLALVLHLITSLSIPCPCPHTAPPLRRRRRRGQSALARRGRQLEVSVAPARQLRPFLLNRPFLRMGRHITPRRGTPGLQPALAAGRFFSSLTRPFLYAHTHGLHRQQVGRTVALANALGGGSGHSAPGGRRETDDETDDLHCHFFGRRPVRTARKGHL